MAGTLDVSGLGVGGWVSGDTRPPTGGAADPSQIAAQIKFMGEGVVVPDAAGGTPDPSPAGSYLGYGYVRLDGTNANAGKSSIGYYDTSGAIGNATALVNPQFNLDYRYYVDSNPTSRTLGLTISLSNGTNTYNLSHVNPANVYDAWNLDSVDMTTGNFLLYDGPGALGGAGSSQTLTQWSTDGTFSFLFNGTYNITGIGFNIGSYQRNALAYLDYTDTNLLNGGDRIDFRVPEPMTLSLLASGLAGLAAVRRRRA